MTDKSDDHSTKITVGGDAHGIAVTGKGDAKAVSKGNAGARAVTNNPWLWVGLGLLVVAVWPGLPLDQPIKLLEAWGMKMEGGTLRVLVGLIGGGILLKLRAATTSS